MKKNSQLCSVIKNEQDMRNEMNTTMNNEMINNATKTNMSMEKNTESMEVTIISTRTSVKNLSVVKVKCADLNPYRVTLDGKVIGKLGSVVSETDSEGRTTKATLTCTLNDGRVVKSVGDYTDEGILTAVANELGEDLAENKVVKTNCTNSAVGETEPLVSPTSVNIGDDTNAVSGVL